MLRQVANLLEKSPQDALTIIENKSKVRNSQSKPIASPVNACDNHSSSELAKLTHAVNQQTSAVTTAMTTMLKQFQSNPPPAQVKAVEEICVTSGGAHPYYQCLAAGGNTFPEYRDNIQGYVLAATGNYNQGNPGYRPQGVANQMRPPATQSNQNFHLTELEKIKRMNDVSLKAMQNQIDMVKNELRNEMKTSIQTTLSKQTNEIKNMMASLLQMNTSSTSGSRTLPGNTISNPKGELKAITTCSELVTDGPTVPNPPKSVNPEEDECVEETYMDPDHTEYTIKVPPAPPVQKPKPPIQRNFVLHTRDSLPPHIPDPGKFLIPCGFSELKCKALANLGASINLMPLSVWKKLGLRDLIPTRMTLELANRAICTPDGIARDVFIPVGKFTFPVDFVVVDYESDPRVPLILGRPFLRTARALIDVHGEEMILHDGDERLTLNMKHDTASYSNHSYRDSVNLINIFNIPNIDSFNDIHPYFDDDPLSGSTTYSANSLLEEFADELALISYPLDYDDTRACDIESDIREIDFLLSQGEDFDFKDSIDQSVLTHRDDLFVDPTPEMFTDEQPPDYSFPPRFDVYPDDFLEIKFDATFDDDLFDSEGEKIKEAELLIDSLDIPCDILSEYDSFNSQDFSRDDVLPFPDNEDKVFNPGILIQDKSVKITTRVTQEKKLAVSYASWLFEDFDPPFYELLVFKEVLNSMRLLSFSSKNKEKVSKPGI
nr:reverse transcriptase domain-containing protein [Tanacetum cinerariifolium]